MEWTIAIIVFLLVFVALLYAFKLFQEREQRDLTRARIYSSDSPTLNLDLSDNPADVFNTQSKSEFALMVESMLSSLGVRLDDPESILARRMMHAGISSPNAVAFYLLYQRVIGPILVIIGLIIIFGKSEGISDLLINLISGGLVVVVGAYGAQLFVENMAQRRRKQLSDGFPDALDLLLVCVESGLTLDSSLNRVCSELGRVHTEITKELNRTRVELSLLNNRSKALQNLGERTNMLSFRYLVAALLQSEKFGTSLSDTLRVMADEYRTKRLVTAEEKAARIPVLMTVPLIFCLMPAFMIIILGPAAISFMESGFLSN